MLFRAKTEKRTRGLRLPKDMNVSVQWAEKGSYREENILKYLDRWLEPLTLERLEARDFRILMLDVARSHVGDDVVSFAAARGYVTLFHYGCTTAVGQVNDTDLHAEFQRLYVELEQLAFHQRQLVDPGNISRSIQEVLDDVVATWRSCGHSRCVDAHKRVGISNALDGSEDHLITREARELWVAAGMAELRAKAIAEVDQLVGTGALAQFSDWNALVRHPSSPGVLQHEGQEFEGELELGELPWSCAADTALEEADAADFDGPGLEDEAAASVAALALPSDPPKVVDQATTGARRLVALKRLRELAISARVPAAVNAVRTQIDHLERGLRDSKGPRAANVLLRRHVDKVMAEEAAKIKAKREEKLRHRRTLLSLKRKMAKAKRVAAAKKKATVALKERLALVPKMFTVEDVGATGPKGEKNRREVLDRLMAGSPPLSIERKVAWPRVRDAYLKHHATKYGAMGGDHFLKMVNSVLQALSRQYKLQTSGAAGDPNAFADFFDSMEKSLPKPTVYALL